MYRKIGWNNVSTPAAQDLALKAAEEGMVLLKNDGTLPLSFPEDRNTTILLLGGWANATNQMQGNYFGTAPFLTSPWMALQNYSNVNVVTPEWFVSPLIAAAESDADIFLWISATTEGGDEGTDRNTVAWDGLTLDPLEMLATLGKPLIFAHMGDQCDDAILLNNPNVSAIVWGGYPGQAGGEALINILTGKAAPAGRLPVTQYNAEYVDLVGMTDMGMRANPETGNPGRTYKW
jgi:xylan 1,4-beta-xylosidase